ncbi:UPF0573 protein C2orf70 homolog [Agrilus planipennis]|uniref:UPF0573 protein C2orf70 homolog n=1 Tax=Agrilus planipennis TaxID=224129 RepID=A0A1W4X990_AGRPL|nr:UPF0573 protein C2orf70 homolog [Agrilus planipennis]
MGGDPNLSDMKATYYPPSIQPAFMGAHPPIKNGYGSLSESANISYFQNYRNENLSKFQMPPYEWGLTKTPYSPRPDIAVGGKSTNWAKMLNMPPSPVTVVNLGRQQEINDFYKLTQLHRDQYKDHTGRLHPYDYFRTADFRYQCPSDPTTRYLKSPQYYVKYKDPAVLPLTLERSFRAPPLPARALTGRFAPSSDISYKR